MKDEKEKRTLELIAINMELSSQYEENIKRTAELISANKQLLYEHGKKSSGEDSLISANKKLAFQIAEKEKRAAELIIANQELAYQNGEKERRAAELAIANTELLFQNDEKEMRAQELLVANKELAFQNVEKENRAAELIIANVELAYQNAEKEKRAHELLIANTELAFQNTEKEKRAKELVSANKKLKKAQQDIRKLNEEDIRKLNDELELKVLERTGQLEYANKELESFSYSVSHDLRAPLRAIEGYAIMLEEEYHVLFDDEGRRLLGVVQENAKRMGVLIDDLLEFSRLGRKEIRKSTINMTELAGSSLREMNAAQQFKGKIKIRKLHTAMGDATLMRQVWINLLSNSIKYSSVKQSPVIEIRSEKNSDEIIYSIADNGVGFDMQYADKLFGVFQRLHGSEEFEGTGVGLALAHRIITRHGGTIWAKAETGKGATFYFSLPA